ncbi:universal stress protein [Horticoccus sp. 23ND18S-11]|uniref:universal stress protein n=1 Tax=Horticoccus sp. 23ND18S-11 TaxID=3391832 RepID=UPI0039C8FD85
MKTILAPIDFSPVSDRVVAEAACLARALDGRVVLLNVTAPVIIAADYTAFIESIAEITDLTAKAAAKELAKIEDRLENEFTHAESIQLTGAAVPAIIDQATKLEADYIVIGSHGHTAFFDLLVGSTASGVLKRAPCPVVVVPAPRKTPAKPAKKKKKR